MTRLVQDLDETEFPVALVCRVLEVPISTFHEAIKHAPSARAIADASLTDTIVEIHADLRGTHGAPRVHAELRLDMGVRIDRKPVALLMQAHAASPRARHLPPPQTSR